MEDFKRILLKLSGEALAGSRGFGFDEATCLDVADQVKQLTDSGKQVAIVIGGGNFWRGRNSSKIIERTKSDQIGHAGNNYELCLCFLKFSVRKVCVQKYLRRLL